VRRESRNDTARSDAIQLTDNRVSRTANRTAQLSTCGENVNTSAYIHVYSTRSACSSTIFIFLSYVSYILTDSRHKQQRRAEEEREGVAVGQIRSARCTALHFSVCHHRTVPVPVPGGGGRLSLRVGVHSHPAQSQQQSSLVVAATALDGTREGEREGRKGEREGCYIYEKEGPKGSCVR
jgi:hypothetical protein